MAKNIVILSDGTWADQRKSEWTNIALFNAFLARDASQQVHYRPGIGTHSGHGLIDNVQNVWAGATGMGINEDIKAHYAFIGRHYEPGDAIYLLGFSRGAYTVRSVVGMLRKCGILKPHQVNEANVSAAFTLYRNERWLGHDPGPDHASAKRFREQYTHFDAETLKREQPIAFLGVFDTVGDLGVPVINVGYIHTPHFHDTGLSRIVQTARHALAIDEHRRGFNACLWTAKTQPKTTNPACTDSEQRWFIGCHCDVGGQFIKRHDDHGLSNLSLSWIAQEAEQSGIKLDPAIYDQYSQTENWRDAIHRVPSVLFPFEDYERPIGLYRDECVDDSAIKRLKRLAAYNPGNLLTYLQTVVKG